MEHGQAVVLVVLAMACLMGVMAFVIDIGYSYLGKRRAQAAADASALAAAAYLPDTSAAKGSSTYYARKNFAAGTIGVSFSNTLAPNDTANTVAAATLPSFFAGVFGIKSFTVRARASAMIATYSGWATNLAPWVTDKQSIKWGQSVSFKVAPGNQASSGNFGGVDLPVQESNCGYSNGSSGYVSLIQNQTHSCLVQAGDQLPVEPGNMGSNTSKALQQRGASTKFDPYTLLRQTASGAYELTTYSHPNLVVIPIIQSFHQGSSAPFTVTGVAWFIITDYTTDTVTGMFVRSAARSGAICPTVSNPRAPCPVGPYNPDGLSFVQLTK